MNAPKPTLGFASRTDAVLALRSQRKSTGEIARLIGIKEKTVLDLEYSAGRRKRQSRPSEEFGRTVIFPLDLLARLGPHAAKRGIHVNHLARLIVETVADEGIIDAVLDDADAVAEASRP